MELWPQLLELFQNFSAVLSIIPKVFQNFSGNIINVAIFGIAKQVLEQPLEYSKSIPKVVQQYSKYSKRIINWNYFAKSVEQIANTAHELRALVYHRP